MIEEYLALSTRITRESHCGKPAADHPQCAQLIALGDEIERLSGDSLGNVMQAHGHWPFKDSK